MKQTAVEWLEEKLIDAGLQFTKGEALEIEQAKEMEKQQIIDAWNNSRKKKSDCSNWNCSGDEKTYDNFKQYYNETFNK